jgi:hypothetical protein
MARERAGPKVCGAHSMAWHASGTLLARHTARLYLERSMVPDNARDNLILDGRIPGLLLIVVVVVVTEATAP